MLIDCDSCEMRGKACGDCVVSFLTIEVRPSDRSTVEVDQDQAAAMSVLAEGGLVPPLRLVRPPRAS
ncbi:hypothetical protein [Demequina iriomotensis]|uniref:hypothetical protein n=1 Tax=Demequina iriomotensis TaxID=1536641 RepID=UPI000781BE8A|nr:hypothetical protein [Demequina iriomotensis]